jgi:hypothetical protein
MKIYQALDWNTHEVLETANSRSELCDVMEWAHPEVENWQLVAHDVCRGCQTDSRVAYVTERFDHYGITTGHWCESCYNSSRYPYRKDAYDPYNEMGTR